VLYFIWNDPPYIAGKGTFIGAMLEQIGFVNACKEERYPSIDSLPELSPAFVFLSSEPFPFEISIYPSFKIDFLLLM
jgi:ABC-type Fe3+-hydroxamate transport system substrate-binding protein